jgi:hypothetical protein
MMRRREQAQPATDQPPARCSRIAPVTGLCHACHAVMREAHLPHGLHCAFCRSCCPVCNRPPEAERER